MLKFGDSGVEVIKLQKILKSQGFFGGATMGNFKVLTEAAVKYFQSTHLGEDGQFLDADGVVGPKTWWALRNPHGAAQKSNLPPHIPKDLTPMRQAVLKAALAEHTSGVHEVPNGSNWGDGVTKYGGRPGWAWCCGFVTYCWREGCVIRFRQFSTWSLWQRAKKEGWFFPLDSKNSRAIIPGNALLFQHKKRSGAWTRTGHIALIARTNKDGRTFNTIGGNEGNRVKFGVRTIQSKDLIGFINPFPDDEQPLKYERGTIKAPRVTGSTR
jgi:hypothetical protein